MVPEYAEKITGQGQKENIAKKALLNESLDIFKLQQHIAHDNGIKTTIQMTYSSLFNEEAVSLAKQHHKLYGDEIALSLLGLPCKQFREKYEKTTIHSTNRSSSETSTSNTSASAQGDD